MWGGKGKGVAWGWGLTWAVALLLTAAVVTWALRIGVERQLQTEADHRSVQFAKTLVAAVPDLGRVLDGQGAPDALRQLRALGSLGDVRRFRLFNLQGTTVLDTADPRHPGAGQAPHDVQPSAAYPVAPLPLHDGQRLIGRLDLQLDMTRRQTALRSALLGHAAVVGLALCVLAGLGAWHWRQHHRAQGRVAARAHYLARHDALSGAVNRSSFADALAQAVQRHQQGGGGFAVLCLDLDRFKEVNDTLGHAAGDEVLRQATARLQGLVRQGDIVARLGGDEFAVLQQGVRGPDAVRMLAQRMIDALSRPYAVTGQASARCGVSVGAALFGPDAPDVQQLMHQADLALYRAKTAGRGGFSFYDAQLDRELQTRRELVRDLRLALERQQLHLHFQAQVAADARTVIGYEALLRWDHPVHGAIPPATFIPLAEDHGLIDTLGGWVLRRACTEAAHWPAPLTVAVNLSAVQFRGDQLLGDVTRALSQSGLAPGRLTLEITESLLMHDTERVLTRLQALAALGVRFAMDDFGTGFSSLAYLWRFPFDKLKIDPVFTQALPDDPKVNLIVRSLVKLAHALEIRVNAEGVESATQLRLLQKHGCDEFQGYLLGRPAPAANLQHEDAVTETPARPGPSDATMAYLPTMPAPLSS